MVAGTSIADLGISVTDNKSYAITGDPITYTVVVTNAGPDAANGVVVTDTLPGTISNVTWTCTAVGGSCSALSGSGNLNTTVDLNAGGVNGRPLEAIAGPLRIGVASGGGSARRIE